MNSYLMLVLSRQECSLQKKVVAVLPMPVQEEVDN